MRRWGLNVSNMCKTAQLRLRAMFSHFQPFFSTVSSESPLKVIDIPWAHSYVTLSACIAMARCQFVSPHCLVAPGYVAPTEVTSPQHRSCVAPTSWLCRPNIKDSPIDLRERSTYKHDTAVRFIDRSKEKFVRLLRCNSM